MERSDKNFRRPGPWSVVPNFTLNDRRLRPCSREARYLYMAGWVHANQYRTDGEITSEDLATLAASLRITYAEIQNAAAELVQAELWRPGLWIIGFLDWCHDAETVKRKAAETAARVKAHRAGKKGFPDPSKETELTEETESNRRQQVRTQVRNALQDQLDGGLKSDGVALHLETDAPYTPTPEEIQQRKEAAIRLRKATEEKLRHQVVA